MKKVLFVASEALPFASSGGLADVIGSLPKALVKQDCYARVVMPLYSSIKDEYRSNMTYLGNIYVRLSWRNQYCGVFMYELDSVKFYFIDNEYYFKRQMLYGNYDDAERYAFFCKAALEILPLIDFFPDILHAHDWQAALSVIYLKLHYNSDPRYNRIKAMFTIHNIEYQGIYGDDIMGDVFELSPWERKIVDWNGNVNLMKGAIECCDILSTVSPRYAEEITHPEFAHSLDPIIRDKAYKTRGVLNGIDTEYYNPSKDASIYKNYTYRSKKGKAENKAALQRSLSLPESSETPVIAMITRLTSHKGLDLVVRVIDEILDDDVQFILLGTGDSDYEAFFRDLEARRHDKVRSIIKYDKDLSKQIYAGSDIFLMPSKSEPCGLAQMIASAYGTVPVVREAGGLFDSIKSYNEYTGEGNGFTFADYNAHDMMFTVRRALGYYRDKEFWQEFVRRIMRIDFSWKASSAEYIKIYEQL